jgi:transglutaminase-like putative cysteine protease
MPILHIRHRTRYRYRQPVGFGEHRIMFRPQEAPDQRVLEAWLDIRPGPAALRAVSDLFGNTVHVAQFEGRADELSFESRLRIDHQPDDPAGVADEAFPARGAPFGYEAEHLPDLTRSIAAAYPDPCGEVERWARRFAPANGRGRVMETLIAMTHAIHEDFRYETRLHDAPRTPAETLALRVGSCRDFAVLMMDAARRLGLAARFASGYLLAGSREVGGGHTHAWTRIFLPSCGWADFDPTNGGVGATRLVRVAVAVEPRQAVPLHGTWCGPADAYRDMQVEVDVRSEDERDPRQSVGVARTG